MNLPQAQGFEAQSFMLYFYCTAERVVGVIDGKIASLKSRPMQPRGYFA
jgi:hypothetical protein